MDAIGGAEGRAKSRRNAERSAEQKWRNEWLDAGAIEFPRPVVRIFPDPEGWIEVTAESHPNGVTTFRGHLNYS